MKKADTAIQPDLYEYMLVISPDTEVHEKVCNEQQHFNHTYQDQHISTTKPHITIAAFKAKEVMEGTLIRWMHRIISMQQSFTVTLNNFSGFPPHTVYARVQDHTPFRKLAAQLKVVDQYVTESHCPPMYFATHPHMSIAKKIPEALYDKAMMDYSQKIFHGSFRVDKLVLLRRQNKFESCRQVNVFPLQPQFD